MDKGTIKTLMCEIPQFDKLEQEELDVMADVIEYQKIEGNTVIVKEGSVGDSLFYIVEGQIEIKKETMEGKHAILARYRKGATVGEMALVEEVSTRSATATAIEDTEILTLSRGNFEKVIDTHPRIAVKILRNIAAIISTRLRYTSGRFADIFK